MLRCRNATNKQSHRRTSGMLWFVLSFCRSRNLEVAFSTSCKLHLLRSQASPGAMMGQWHKDTNHKTPSSQSFTTKVSTLNLHQNLYTNCATTKETIQTSTHICRAGFENFSKTLPLDQAKVEWNLWIVSPVCVTQKSLQYLWVSLSLC